LRGEEFNAVNEAAPRLMKALADGIGVPIGALKDMASNGEITSKVMAQVLPQALEQRDEAKQVQTVAGAFTVLKNNVLEFRHAGSGQRHGFAADRRHNAAGGELECLMGVVATVTAVKIANSFTEWATGAYQSVAANRALAAANLATAQTNVAATAAAGYGRRPARQNCVLRCWLLRALLHSQLLRMA
jgi:phage-related minor tail protein